MDISIIILAKNEERTIREYIESVLPFHAEIVVLDDHSSDKACEIARSLGARVESAPFNMAGFGEKRRLAAALATHDIVFHLDSDKRLTWELIQEIATNVSHMKTNEVIEIPRLTYLFNQPIRHCGWYPDYSRRIYNRKHTDFSNALVHETLSLLSIPFRAAFFFIKIYSLQLGFSDGKAGHRLPLANLSYEWSKYLCYMRLRMKKKVFFLPECGEGQGRTQSLGLLPVSVASPI